MPDLLPILEAAYDLTLDASAGLAAITTATAEAIDDRSILLGCEIPPTHDFSQLELVPFEVRHGDHDEVRAMTMSNAAPSAQVRELLGMPPCFWLGSERLAGTPLLAAMRSRGISDFGVIHAPGADGGGLNLSTTVPAVGTWSAARRAAWDAVAAHLGAAWRLRRRLGQPAIMAELDVDGRVRDANGSLPATSRDALRRAVRQREAARRRRGRSEPSPLWPALVEGRWTLLDRFTAAGVRHVVACENPPDGAHLRGLGPRERIVIELVLDGRSSKWIALDLGLSEPTVSRILRGALRRLGAGSLTALAGVRAALFEPADDGVSAARMTSLADAVGRLTRSELAVVGLLLEGRSSAVIAARRGTSARTVAHQLTAIYAKLGVSSRRELVARLA